MENEEDFLKCKYCGGKAIIKGKWVNAVVECLDCGIVRPAKEYEEEIEKLKDKWIEAFSCELDSNLQKAK